MKLFEFTGYVTELRSDTNLKDCRCAEITVVSKHCQIMRDNGSSTSYFMKEERKFRMDQKSIEAFRLGQKVTITLSSED